MIFRIIFLIFWQKVTESCTLKQIYSSNTANLNNFIDRFKAISE